MHIKLFSLLFFCALVVFSQPLPGSDSPSKIKKLKDNLLKITKNITLNEAQFRLDRDKQIIFFTGRSKIEIKGWDLAFSDGWIDIKKQKVYLKNGVQLKNKNRVIVTNEINIDLTKDVWSFQNIHLKNKNFTFSAKTTEKKNNKYFLKNMFFTSCQFCKESSPAWSVTSSNSIVAGNRVYSWWTFLNIKSIPIIPFPYLSFPIHVKRATGFLFPTLFYTKRSGAGLIQSFFWNINNSTDMTLTGVFYKQGHLQSSLHFRKLYSETSWSNLYMSGFNQHLNENKQWFASYKHKINFFKNIQNSLQVQWISDSDYLQNYFERKGFLKNDLGASALENHISFSKLIETDNWTQYVQVLSKLYQNLLEKENSEESFRKQPAAQYSLLQKPILNNKALFNLNANYDHFFRKKTYESISIENGRRRIAAPAPFNPQTDLILSGQRLKLNPTLTIPLKYKSIFQSFLTLSFDQLIYKFAPENKDSLMKYRKTAQQNRFIGYFEGGTQFFKIFRSKSFDYKHVLEPKINYSASIFEKNDAHSFFKNNTQFENEFQPITDDSFYSPQKTLQFDHHDNITGVDWVQFVLNSYVIQKNIKSNNYNTVFDFSASQKYYLTDLQDRRKDNLHLQFNVSLSQFNWGSKFSYDHETKKTNMSTHLDFYTASKKNKNELGLLVLYAPEEEEGFIEKTEILSAKTSWEKRGFKFAAHTQYETQKKSFQQWGYDLSYASKNKCWVTEFGQTFDINRNVIWDINFKLLL